MAPDVRRTFAAIYGEKRNVSAETGESWLNRLEADGRYLAEVSSAV
jgi:sulfite reductase alpha subunit-like flavoprotein